MTTNHESDLEQNVIEGERIYANVYQRSFESKYQGQFAAVDVKSGAAYVAQYPEQAIEKAMNSHSDASLHLVCIGSPSAFNAGLMMSCADDDLARIV
jgi:hypothetical protein